MPKNLVVSRGLAKPTTLLSQGAFPRRIIEHKDDNTYNNIMDENSDATVLTIYTNDFDANENVVNGGMSGKVFLDGHTKMEFINLDSALEYMESNGMQPERIDINYVGSGYGGAKTQKFWKFHAKMVNRVS